MPLAFDRRYALSLWTAPMKLWLYLKPIPWMAPRRSSVASEIPTSRFFAQPEARHEMQVCNGYLNAEHNCGYLRIPKRTLMKFKCWCPILFFAASTLASDPSKISGVEGFVTLNAVASLPGVTIGVGSQVRGTHLQTTTNTSGYYLFDEIRPRAYTMWAEARTYGCILIPRVVVHYGERVRQDFNFVRGKAYGGCEPVDRKKPK